MEEQTVLDTVSPSDLCGGRIKEQLLCHRSSQLSGVWKASGSGVPQAKLVFSSAAGSGTWQCVWEGCVCAAAAGFVVDVHHHITAHSSSSSSRAIPMMSVWCFTCCAIWVQWALWEIMVLELAKRGNFDQDLTRFHNNFGEDNRIEMEMFLFSLIYSPFIDDYVLS